MSLAGIVVGLSSMFYANGVRNLPWFHKPMTLAAGAVVGGLVGCGVERAYDFQVKMLERHTAQTGGDPRIVAAFRE